MQCNKGRLDLGFITVEKVIDILRGLAKADADDVQTSNKRRIQWDQHFPIRRFLTYPVGPVSEYHLAYSFIGAEESWLRGNNHAPKQSVRRERTSLIGTLTEKPK